VKVGEDPVAVADGDVIQFPSDIKFKVQITRDFASGEEPSSGGSA